MCSTSVRHHPSLTVTYSSDICPYTQRYRKLQNVWQYGDQYWQSAVKEVGQGVQCGNTGTSTDSRL